MVRTVNYLYLSLKLYVITPSNVTCLDSLQLSQRFISVPLYSYLKIVSTYGVDTLLAFLMVALVAVDVELLEVVLRVRGFVVGGGADDLERKH